MGPIQIQAAQTHTARRTMRSYEIQSFTYERRSVLMPRLSSAVADSGAWLVERRTPAPERVELVFELRAAVVVDLYGAMAQAGLELSRSAEQTLVALCARGRHLGRRHRPAQPLCIRLEIRFLEDAPLSTAIGSCSLMV
jgi:hypothetical protein